MIGIGLITTLGGFLIALLSLELSSSTSGRMIATLAGLAVSLFGIIGLINRAYLKNAVWKK